MYHMIWIMYVTISSWNPASLGPKRLSEYFIEIILFKTALLEELLYRLLNYWANESLEVMLKAIKRSKVFLGRKNSQRLLSKYSFFSWYMHLLQTFILFWFFPKVHVQIASLHICLKCLESDLEKFNMYSIFSPGNIGVCLGLYPGLGENMTKVETSLSFLILVLLLCNGHFIVKFLTKKSYSCDINFWPWNSNLSFPRNK